MKTEPTEALNLLHTATEPNTQGPMKLITKYEAELALRLAFKEGQENPKIKQLEWVENGFDLISETLFGRYTVSKPALGIAFILYINNNVKEAFLNLDEAKAAAQEDFEMRVKGCLICE